MITAAGLAAQWDRMESGMYDTVIMSEAHGRDQVSSAGVHLGPGQKEKMVNLLNLLLAAGAVSIADDLTVASCMRSQATFVELIENQLRQFMRRSKPRNDDCEFVSDSMRARLLEYAFDGKDRGQQDDVCMAFLHAIYQMCVFYLHPGYAAYRRGGVARCLVPDNVFHDSVADAIAHRVALVDVFNKMCEPGAAARGNFRDATNPRRA